MKTTFYILVRAICLIGLGLFLNCSSVTKGKEESRVSKQKLSDATVTEEHSRKLRLVVSYGFGDSSKTITENATTEIIKQTMKTIDWTQFHIVYLEDELDNSLDVGGSLYEDGLASGIHTYNSEILKVPPPKSVEEMTDILVTYLKGEKSLKDKYKYE